MYPKPPYAEDFWSDKKGRNESRSSSGFKIRVVKLIDNGRHELTAVLGREGHTLPSVSARFLKLLTQLQRAWRLWRKGEQNARETEGEGKTALCCRQPQTGDLISDPCKLFPNPYFVVLLTLLRDTRCLSKLTHSWMQCHEVWKYVSELRRKLNG